MKIIQNTNNLLIPDVYALEVKPPELVTGVDADIVGFVGTAEKGQPNLAYDIYGYSDVVKIFGNYDAKYTIAVAAIGLIRQGATRLKPVRVVGSGAAAASISLKDGANADTLKLSLRDPGAFGNSSTVKIENGALPSTYKVTLSNRGTSEVYDNVTLVSTDSNYLVNKINANSEMYKAEKLAGADTLALVASATAFTGGNDGAAVTDTEIVGKVETDGSTSGLKVLETSDANIIFAAEVGSDTVNDTLSTMAAATNKFAVLCGPKSQLFTAALTKSGTYNTDRSVYTYPWVSYLDQNTLTNNLAAPNSYIAGILATIPEEQSPSYVEVQGINGTEFALSDAEIAQASDIKNNLMVISQTRGKFRVRNGYTLSKETNKRQVYRRRMTDYIMYNLDDKLHFATSKPNSPKLREEVFITVDSFLADLKANQRIKDYSVVCDESNNPATVQQQGILYVDVKVALWSSADFIILRVESGDTVKIITN